MLKINDSNSPSPISDSGKMNSSTDLSDLFKSIYRLKIDNKIENVGNNNFHTENNKKSSSKESFKKSIQIGFQQKRSDLLLKAEIAKKSNDLDIQNAKDLLDKIEERLDKKSNKKLRISRGNLKSAVRGISKLADVKDDKDKSSAFSDNMVEATKAAEESIELGLNIELQFKDSKVNFSLIDQEGAELSEDYEGEISVSNHMVDDNSEGKKNDTVKTNQTNATMNQETNDELEALNLKSANSELGTEQGNKIAKKIMDLVEEKSALAAEQMSEDANLKIEIEPKAKNVKQNSEEKIIIANQNSVNTLIAPQDKSDNQISKIAPSGNLKSLLSTQNGVLQVTNTVEIPILELEAGSEGFSAKKESLLQAEVNAFLKKSVAEIPLDANQMNNGYKSNQNGASASVLDRINQVAMVQKISNRIQLRQLKEFGIVNIHLDPPELGKLIVKLSIKNKDIKVSIIADCDSSYEMLKNHKQVFMKSLRENGLEVTEFNVSTKENSGSNNFFNSNNQENQSQHNIKVDSKENKNGLNKTDFIGSREDRDLKNGHQISLIA